MPSAATLRRQIEANLANRIPSALTPAPRIIRPVLATGIAPLDDLLKGGLPVGGVSELTGSECSGRTSVALSFLAQLTQAGKVCAWIDVTNALDPASAAAVGVDLDRLLWVRCGVTQRNAERKSRSFVLPEKYLVPVPAKKGLHGGGFGPHPRSETNGLSRAVGDLLAIDAIAPCCAEPQRRAAKRAETFAPNHQTVSIPGYRSAHPTKLWSRIADGLRATDLLLQGGGFSAIVLDLAGIAAENALRIPLSHWHRYRVAAERTQSSILLLTQHSCAKSSAELLLHFHAADVADVLDEETTVFTGLQPRVEVVRQRFVPTNVIPVRKGPQSVHTACWHSRTTWAGRR
jgi:recombination protein RecA